MLIEGATPLRPAVEPSQRRATLTIRKSSALDPSGEVIRLDKKAICYMDPPHNQRNLFRSNMDEAPTQRFDVSRFGGVEPHAALLRVPPQAQPLYKIMSVENLLRSIESGYLHFNRVDRYSDFPGADPQDSEQLPEDRPINASARFEKHPEFSAADYYDRSRARTYACCFSMENSELIWRAYANDNRRGKVCVVFEFGKLRQTLNQILRPGNAALDCASVPCHQIFSLN